MNPVESPIEVWHGITRLVRGGAQGVVLDLIAGLDRSRFRPVLVAGTETGSEGSLWPEAEALAAEHSFEIIRIPTLVRAVSPLSDLRTLSTLTRQLRRRRPALVHAHTSKAGFLLCRAARRARIEGIILSPHGHIAGQGAQIPGIPQRGMKRAVLAALARRSAHDADVVVCPNEDERRDGIALRMWRDDRSIVVPNGVDTERFVPGERRAARRDLGLPLDAPVIGVVARLTREKGVDLAVEALARIPGAHLVLVGDGPEREALHALSEERDLTDRVHFLGVRSDVPHLYPAFDVLCVPSRTEAHGMVAAEALSCEVPVVAAEVGGLKSLVDVGRTGCFFESGDAGALARELSRVLDDAPWRARLGAAGRKQVIEKWSVRAMLLETESLYLRTLAGRRELGAVPRRVAAAEGPAS